MVLKFVSVENGACQSFAGGLVSTNVISVCPQMGGGACPSS